MKKDLGEISDIRMFEELIMVARKHSVDSFSYGKVTVNLGTEMPDTVPEMPDTPTGMIDDELFNDSKSEYSLLNSPQMRS